MNVLHVGKYYYPFRGGMETALRSLCEGTIGHSAAALVANVTIRTRVERMGRVEVIRAGTLWVISSIPFCPSFPLWLRRRRADVVCLHEPNPTALFSYLLVRPPGRLVIWFHSQIIGRPLFSAFYRPFLKAALAKATRIVVASPTLRDHTPALAPFSRKCVLIPYGIDLNRFAMTAAVRARVEVIRGTIQTPIVLFVGRLTYYKGVDHLITAISKTDATLIVVGDGAGRPSLENHVRSLGLESRVRFAGEVDDDELHALYRASDVFVLPSVEISEAFGIVQLEAMACGKPIVSTNLPTGISWVNQHEVTGLVVEPRNPDALAAALNRLLQDETLRDRYGKQARARVEAEFSEPIMRERAAALFTLVAAQS